MSLSQRIKFLQDLFQMTGIVLLSVINHYHINGLHLFWDTLYDEESKIFGCIYFKTTGINIRAFHSWILANVKIFFFFLFLYLFIVVR